MMARCWPLTMPPVSKAVLISLADNANDAGFCWPSIETICERTCYGRTAVIDAIKWLEENGHLSADRSNGRKTTYTLHPVDSTRKLTKQSAKRTGTPDGPVRQTDSTSPPRGLNQSARRTLTVKNHQEPSSFAPSDENSPDAESAVERLPLIGDKEYPVPASQADEWTRLFPAVDVPQELRSMRAWLLANPKNRKTRSGVARFVSNWLTKSQNSARVAVLPTIPKHIQFRDSVDPQGRKMVAI